MPKNLTDVSVFTNPVVCPVDGDPLRATNCFETPLQALANRTRYLKEQVASVKRLTQPIEFLRPVLDADWSYPSHLGGFAQSEANAVYLLTPLRVYAGETLTGADIKLKPGTTRATIGNRMLMSIVKLDHNFSGSVPTVSTLGITSADTGSSRADDGTAAYQVRTLTLSTPVVVTDELSFYMQINSGNDSGTNKDVVHAVRTLVDTNADLR
jgi:hypothetical protein